MFSVYILIVYIFSVQFFVYAMAQRYPWLLSSLRRGSTLFYAIASLFQAFRWWRAVRSKESDEK